MNIHTLSPLLIILAIFSLVGCAQKEINWDLKSPDKSIKILLTWQTNDTTLSELSYKVISESDSGSVTVIMNSPLGITREDQDFSRGLIPGKERNVSESDETYKMITGKASEIRNHFNALTVPFTTASGKMMEIDLRAYDDGIAFRYRFPENDSMVYTVTGESTGFTIPMSGKSWIQPYDAVTQYSPAYETYYGNGIEISSKSPGREGWSFPALFETKGFWILITEANLGPNFYGAHLQPEAGGGLYQIRLPEKEEARRLYPAEPISTLPWTSPWRMAIIGKTPAAIIESNLVNNLNDPSIVEDQSWIKPGKASWSWWSDNPSPTDYQKQTVFVDLAATMGWEYILVDANWDRMRGGKVEDLIEYAKGKSVGVWLWYNSGGPHNTVTEAPKNLMFRRDVRRKEFQRLSNLGVKGVKIDFFQSDKPEMIRLYHEILQDAKEFRIMCNFHGCTLPRGWARTYPHNLSSEAVRGAECYIFDRAFPESAPVQNCILPFTRNAVGSMDYTPVALSDQNYKHLTTYGHEIALSVIFESGIQHFADKAAVYLQLPDFARNFLSSVPNTWDRTIFLDGYPGEFIVLARQKNGQWYIGGINGTTEEKEITISLPFINEGSQLLEIITDGEKERSFMYFKKPFDKATAIPLTLIPRGGFAGRLIMEE